MKCQHCGIHFDDEERVCPMCGARAGSKGRMTRPEPKWHGKPRETYTEYHPTIENSSSAKTAKSKARPIKDKPKKKRAKGAVIAVIVIALLQFVPTLIAFVVDDLVPEIESSFGNAPAPEYDSDYSDDYDTDYDSDYAYDTLYDVFGDNGITVSAFDNVYTFQASGDGSSYEFSYTENGNRTFRSTGTAFCYREDDEDYYYRDEYPYDEYIMYSVYLYPEHQETNGPQQDWCDSMMRSKVDSILLNVFQSRTTDEVVVEDMDGVGLFGSGNVLPFNKVQEG